MKAGMSRYLGRAVLLRVLAGFLFTVVPAELLFYNLGSARSHPSLLGARILTSASMPARTLALCSPEAIQKIILGSTGDEIRGMLRAPERDLWIGSPNAGYILRLAFQKLAVRFADGVKEAMSVLVDTELPLPALRALATQAFYGCAVATNPSESEVRPLLASVNPELRTSLLSAFVQVAPGSGPRDTYSILKRYLSDDPEEEICIEITIALWIKRLPKETTQFIDSLAIDNRLRGRGECLNLLSVIDQNLAQSYLDECVANMSAKEIVDLLDQTNLAPTDVAAFASRLAPEKQSPFLLAYYRSRSPLEIPDLAEAFPAARLPSDVATLLCKDLIAGNAGLLANWLQSLPADAKDRLLDESAGDHGALFDATAASLYLSLRSSKNAIPGDCLQKTFSSLAETDLSAALASAARLPPEQQSQAREIAYKAGLIPLKNDLLAISQYCRALPPSASTAVTESAVRQLVETNPANALEFCKLLPEPARTTAEATALSNEEMPLDLLEKTCLERLASSANPQAYSAAVSQLVNRYAALDSEKAVECINAISDDTMKASAISSLLNVWCKSDPISASDWVATFPTGDLKDKALLEVSEANYDDPANAFDSISSISDPSLRIEAENAIIAKWTSSDLTPLLEAMTHSKLAPDDQAAVQAAAQRR